MFTEVVYCCPELRGRVGPFENTVLCHGLQVKHIFGYPGGAILPVFDAIYNCKEMELILPRHEQGGAHMAEGYSRARYIASAFV